MANPDPRESAQVFVTRSSRINFPAYEVEENRPQLPFTPTMSLNGSHERSDLENGNRSSKRVKIGGETKKKQLILNAFVEMCKIQLPASSDDG